MAREFRKVACAGCGKPTLAQSAASVKCYSCLKRNRDETQQRNRSERDARWAEGRELAVRGRFGPGQRSGWAEWR